MNRMYFFSTILIIFFSCNTKSNKVDNVFNELNVEDTTHVENKTDVIRQITPSFYIGENGDSLRIWKERVVKDADRDAYNGLSNFYDDVDQYESRDEIIRYSKIMADKYPDPYMDIYYLHVRYSNLPFDQKSTIKKNNKILYSGIN